MNNNITTNTHDYDKKIGPIYRELLAIDKEELTEPLTFVDCIQSIELCVEQESEILAGLKQQVKKTINLLKSDTRNNYDPLNDINVEELLPRTWRFIEQYDSMGKMCFLEQMTDIVGMGPCSQGRTTRIFQFYEYHMNNRQNDDIYKNVVKKIDI